MSKQYIHLTLSERDQITIMLYEGRKIREIAKSLGRDKSTISRESALRSRGFRQAIIEAYDYRCAFCGLKIKSPDSLYWEVEAAHIVPHSSMGKDDIWNGLALCSLHHWAFDVGWFTLGDDFNIQVSPKVNSLSSDFGRVKDYDFIRVYSSKSSKIILPKRKENYPHQNSIRWHRENKYFIEY